MISLRKRDEPEVLVANRAAWTAEFEGGVDNRRYAHSEISDALRIETGRKCAYCESRMEHVSFVNIEHIAPKSAFPALVCEWRNLTLACTACNTRKGTYYEADCLVVNPYDDDPNDHLTWLGPMVFEVTPDRGRVTITRLDLNRAELMYQRGQRLARAREIMTLMENNIPSVAAALTEDLRTLQLDDAEYAGAVRAFVSHEAAAA